MRQVILGALVAAILAAPMGGCQNEHVITIRVRSLSTDACEGLQPLASWPDERECALFRVRDSAGNPLGLRISERAGDLRYGAILLPRSKSGMSTLHVELPETDDDVTVDLQVFNETGALLATGKSPERPLCAGCTVALTVSPPDRFSCSGATIEGDGPGQYATERRALHSATLLSNGEVLILGGVGVSSEDAVIPRDAATEVPLARRVEVFDPAMGSFHRVTVSNSASAEEPEAFRRVFHQPVYLGLDPVTGLHKIRVLGGLSAPARSTGLALRWAPSSDDEHFLPSVYRLPMVPGNSSTNAVPVDLFYDPSNRTARVEAVVDEGIVNLRRTSLTNSVRVGGSTVLTAGMYIGTDGQLRVGSEWFFINAPDGALGGNDRFPLTVQRIGHSATLLREDPWAALLWGGDVRSADNDLPTADAFPHNRDTCPWISNPTQEISGSDGWGDACRDDHDSDGILNDEDNCPDVPNAEQSDLDTDGTGDICDDEGPGFTPYGEIISSMVVGSTPLRRSATSAGGPNKLPLESVFHGSVTVERDAVMIYGGYRMNRYGVLFPTKRDTMADLPGAYMVMVDSLEASHGEVRFQTLDEGEAWPRVILPTIVPLSDPFARDGSASHRVLILGGAEAGPVDRSDLMTPSGLARIVTFTRNAQGTFDWTCEDLGMAFGSVCSHRPNEGPRIHRWGHTATMMQDGTVLIVGGFTVRDPDNELRPLWQAEIFNPTSASVRAPAWGGETPCPSYDDGPIGLEPISDLPPDAGPGDGDIDDGGPGDSGFDTSPPEDADTDDGAPGDADPPSGDSDLSGDGDVMTDGG